MPTLTLKRLRKLLAERFGGKLTTGKHEEDGAACVRELRACALGLPWSDHPDGDNASPTDRACQVLNDACWPSDEARTEGCLELATLTETNAAPGWLSRYVERTIREILPMALEAAASVHPQKKHADAMHAAADRCRQDGDKDAAANAADAADAAHAVHGANAAYAAYAAAYASAAAAAAVHAAHAAAAAVHAAHAAADAAAVHAVHAAAANAAAKDNVLRTAVKIMVECHTGCQTNAK